MSESDLVYDRPVADEKLGSGSKYQRLAALVYKVMEANADVVHHVILRAPGKRAEHEIDVAVTANGAAKELLIECRDRGRKAALSYRFPVHEAVEEMVVKASGVAEMILHHVTGPDAGEGRVFFDEHFNGVRIGDGGRVVES